MNSGIGAWSTFLTGRIGIYAPWRLVARTRAPGRNRAQDEVVNAAYTLYDDPDGMNLRDYYANNTGEFEFAAGTFFDTFLRHNCLENQDDL